MQLKTQNFTPVYNQLNTAQREAVDTLEGPVMVVAGPGTGKTQVLTARIANILLKTDADPHSILALTFTESAAKNMRERLVSMIGQTGYYVQIQTFHAFCSQVIADNPDQFPIERDSQALSDLERYQLFEDLIMRLDLEKLRPINAPLLYLRDIVSSISNLKREGIGLDDLVKIVEAEEKEFAQIESELTKTKLRSWQKNLAKHRDLIKLYQAYEQDLRSKKRFDFDDMISLVVKAFSQEELFLRDYQEKLHFFLVDEYQDTNTAQNKVVDLLASYWAPNANVFVVGDPNQSIYRFQGASVENMVGFLDRYPNTTLIALEKGYRCPQEIYNNASAVIAQNQLLSKMELDGPKQQFFSLLNLTLNSAKGSSSKPKLRFFKAPVQTLETVFVAEEIKKLIQAGTEPEKIAVLFRYNSDVVEISQALEKWGIRYEVDGGNDILESKTMSQLLNFFQVLLQLRSGETSGLVYEVLQYPWFELDQLSLMKLGRAAGQLQMGIPDLVDRGYEFIQEKELESLINEQEFAAIKELLEQFYLWSQADLTQTFTQWFEEVVKEAGFMDWMLAQENKIDLLNQLNSLYNEIKGLTAHRHELKLVGFLQAIELMREHNLRIKLEDLNIREDAVHLSTVHKAKGQEWDHVFLIHFVDGKWGNKRTREMIPLPEGILENTKLDDKEQNEDERRVFYVALTRAAKTVTITSPETFITDNQTREAVVSQFLGELETVEKIDASNLLEDAEKHLVKLIEPPRERVVELGEREFFFSLVKNLKLSVTTLNTYLRDPEDFVKNNLLRLPRSKPIQMSFGTAVHTAFEKMFSAYLQTGQKLSEDQLVEAFRKSLANEVLTAHDRQERLAYGEQILRNYYQKTKDQEPRVFEVERFIGSGWSRAVLDDIYLTGRLDRVDWLDKDKRQVVVVDYKTGKPKTEGYIEGQTKSANLSEREMSLPETIRGPYKRQLLFYKLLAELDQSFVPEVTHGRFEFIEPYDKATGRLMPREFGLSDEAVSDLKELIREVMKEIRSLEFLKQI